MADTLDMKAVVVHNFIVREYGTEHHKMNDETDFGRMLQAGDPQAIQRMVDAIASSSSGVLSRDPVNNRKYLFVSGITLITRFCIAAGLDEQETYYTSDLFIQALDSCHDEESVLKLGREMAAHFVKRMSMLHNTSHCSKPVYESIQYIDEHLHERISVQKLAELATLTPDHLTRLFKKETGETINSYIRKKKLDTACRMLRFSEFTCSEIAFYLGFTSQSYFIKVFRDQYKITPDKYRKHAHQLPFTGKEYNPYL